MIQRKVLLRKLDGTLQRLDMQLPGILLNPPSILLYDKVLYKYTGSGGGGDWTNFYKELDKYYIYPSDNLGD